MELDESMEAKREKIQEDLAQKAERRGEAIAGKTSKAAARNEAVKSKTEEKSQKEAEAIAEKQRRIEEDMSKKHENRGASITRLASKLAGRHEAVKSKSEK